MVENGFLEESDRAPRACTMLFLEETTMKILRIVQALAIPALALGCSDPSMAEHDAGGPAIDASASSDSGNPMPPGNPGDPVVLFTDLTHAPNVGWSASEPDRGAVVTLWGRNLGAVRANSYVTVSGVDLVDDSDYPEPWGETGRPVAFLQRVSFWLDTRVPDGPGEVTVTVGERTSNPVPLTINDGRIYFVDGSATEPGDGSHAQPWSDPGSFIAAMAPGDIGYFRTALYDQRYNGGKQNIWLRDTDTGGTIDAPIAFVGYPGDTPLFDSRTNGSNDFHSSFRFVAPHITLAKVSIDAHAIGVSAGDDSRIIGNDIRGGAQFLSGSGIVITNGDGARILGNSVHGGRTGNRLDHAIYVSGCAPRTGSELAWNHIFDNDFERGPMVVVNHQEDRCPSDVFVRSHIIRDNLIDCSDHASRAIGIFDLSWDGGAETEPEPTYVYNNIAYRCGIVNHAAMYQNAAHARFYNNTIYQSRDDGISVAGERVLSSHVMNNIVDLDGSSTTYLDVAGAGVIVSHNLYSGAGDYAGADPAPVNGDPGLEIDLGDWTFGLTADSPAIDSGSGDVAGIVTADFLWNARPLGSGYDIGAIERVP